jgi:hypothetical protein
MSCAFNNAAAYPPLYEFLCSLPIEVSVVLFRYHFFVFPHQLSGLLYDADRLCGVVVRVPSYRSRGPGFDFRCYQIF